MKKPLPKGEGNSIIWNRPTRLAIGFALSEGVPTSTANALSTQTVSAIIRGYGGFTAISDLVSLTSITSPMKMAAERLGRQAAETLDSVIRQEIFSHVSVTNSSSHSIAKTSVQLEDYWGLTSTSRALVSSTNVIAVSDIKRCVYELKKLDVPAYEGNDYVAIIHPEIAEDLVGDSSWINFHQYAAPGQTNLYSGEIGKIYGCRFVETTLAPISSGSSVGNSVSTVAYGTVVMGKGYYGATELDGGVKTYIVDGASKADPLNQTSLYGWKCNFTTKVLNTSAGVVFWSGSGNTATSASDFNYWDPDDY